MVLENPRVEQHKICEALLETTRTEVSISTICRVMRKYSMTRRKIQSVDIQRSLLLRSRFMAHALAFPSHFFVWVDKTGADCRNFMRKYGYSLRGERAIKHRFIVRGKRINAIAAISTIGLITYEFYHSNVNSDHFCEETSFLMCFNMMV